MPDSLKELRSIGRQMMAAGGTYWKTPTGAFSSQRGSARKRGIDWSLSLCEWWNIWQQSGKWEQRGPADGYVMCRRGDAGPYDVENVFIATARENHSEGIRKCQDIPVGVWVRKLAKGHAYSAYIQVSGRRKCLGSFKTPEEARAAYLAALAEAANVRASTFVVIAQRAASDRLATARSARAI